MSYLYLGDSEPVAVLEKNILKYLYRSISHA